LQDVGGDPFVPGRIFGVEKKEDEVEPEKKNVTKSVTPSVMLFGHLGSNYSVKNLTTSLDAFFSLAQLFSTLVVLKSIP
jgi:hypothetical protein